MGNTIFNNIPAKSDMGYLAFTGLLGLSWGERKDLHSYRYRAEV
jgi:hypothetical protein